MIKKTGMELQSGIVQTLQRIPWFHELESSDLEKLAEITRLIHLHDGDILFTEGEPENGLFVLLEGEIALVTHVPMYGPVQIFTAEPLDLIGWSSLTPVVRQRTDTARALSNCMLVCFNSELLRQLCDDDPTFGYLIMRRIANVAASRLLTTRLHLFGVIREQSEKHHEQI
jgi:CRP/FNR family transcriptional regulator, cyclic AMP receptor protein